MAKSGSNTALGRNPKPIVKAKNLHSEPKVPKGKVSTAFRDIKNTDVKSLIMCTAYDKIPNT